MGYREIDGNDFDLDQSKRCAGNSRGLMHDDTGSLHAGIAARYTGLAAILPELGRAGQASP